MLTDLHHRLRALFRRADVEQELADELQFHLDKEVERLVRDGLPLIEARRQAQITLGGVEQVKERARDARGIGLIEHVRRDVGHAFYLARKQWGFTAGVTVSLAVGLGTATAVFHLMATLVLADLPIPHPEQFFAVARRDNNGRDPQFTWSEYQALKQTGVGTFAAIRGTSAVAVKAGDRSDIISVNFVDGSYFPLAGIQALRGRLLNANDDAQRERVTVLTAWYARKLFGSDTTAVGQTVDFRGVPFAVVGVLPRDFKGLDYPGLITAVIPMGAASYFAGARDNYGEAILTSVDAGPTKRIVSISVRLANPSAARLTLEGVFQRCCRTNANESLELVEGRHGIPGGKSDFRNAARMVSIILLFGIGLVLVVVCCNIASLLLVRASVRQKEIAVRLALGGSRTRLVGQLIAENAPAALFGGLGSLAVAQIMTTLFVSGLPAQVRLQADMTSRLAFHPSPLTLGFAALLTLACVVGFSLFPALRATDQPLAQSLRLDSRASRSRGQGRLAQSVVIAQVAVTMALVTAASLLTVTLTNVSRVDGGFGVDHRLLLRLEARSTRWEQGGLQPIMPEILRRIRLVPGVTGVASSTRLPLFGGSMSPTDVRVAGYVEPAASASAGMSGMGMSMTAGPDAAFIGADPGYFAASGVRLVSGREFTDQDRVGAEPVAIVSTAFQRRYFQGRDPLGETFGAKLGSDTAFTNVRVVGVAGDAKYGTLREPFQPYFYVPFAQAPGVWTRTVMVVRTEGDPMRLVHAVTQAVEAAAPGLHALGALDMVTTKNDALAMERMSAQLGGFISTMALLLSAVGLYGVIAYSVSRRTSEIGVRLALGAPAQAVLWLIGKETGSLVGIGLLVGVPLALATGAALRAPLYGVGAFDPTSMSVAALLLGVAGLLASIVPARRAARIDPKVALSAE